MRARMPQPRHIEWVTDTEDQPLQPGEVRVQPLAVGICGSDLHTFEGQHPFVTYPVYPGHEVAGTVVEAGPGVPSTCVGARITLEPSLTCGVCDACRSGRYNICDNLRVMGFQAPGGMAERFVVPVRNLHRLPDGMSPEIGAMIEPLAVAVHAVNLTRVSGKSVGVVGAGTIGLLVAQVAASYGAADVVIVDLVESRRRVAERLGMKAPQQLARHDVVFECVGNEPALDSSIRAAKKGGMVILVGVYAGPTRVPSALIQDWELHLLGSLMYTFHDYREAIHLADADLVNLQLLISHRYRLREVAEAFDAASRRGSALKVLLLG